MTGTLTAEKPYDIIVLDNPCATCSPNVQALRYYFPIVFEFELNGQYEIRHFTTSGQSLNSVFTNKSGDMIAGQSYPSAPPSNANYKYVGYKKTDTGDEKKLKELPISSGVPSFTYNGDFEKYIVNYYYEPIVGGSGHKATIKYMTRDGKSIPEMPNPAPETMVKGNEYAYKHQVHPNYTFVGHAKTTTGVDPVIGNLVSLSDPPGFNFNGGYDYKVNFYYDPKPTPSTGAGKVIVYHMVRTAPSTTLVLAEEETLFVSKLPGSITALSKTSHGKVTAGNYSYSSRPTSAISGKSSFTLELTASKPTAYVVFYYDKEQTGPPGLFVDFDIEKQPTMYFGDQNKLTPSIAVTGAACSYRDHTWSFNQGAISKSYGPSNAMSQPFWLSPPYDGMGLGTITITLDVTTSCGLTGSVTKSVQVISDPTNRPPLFNIGWFKAGNLYGWEPDAQIVLRGEQVNLRVIVNPLPPEFPGGGMPYDPDGDEISYFWQFGDSSSEWIRGLPDQYGLDPTLMGFTNLLTSQVGSHQITAMAIDSRGASSTRTAVLNVVSPEPTPIITVPARVVQNRPIPEDGINGKLSYAAPERTIRDYHWTNKRTSYPNIGVETVELEVTDNYGVRNLPEMKATKQINVVPDLPPIARLELPERALREGFEITNTSESPDGDIIIRSTIRYRYDSNNDGSFDDEPAHPFVLSVGESRTFKPLKVGKYRFDIEVEEDWGLKHKDSFYLEVVNEMPTVGFSLKGENPEPPQFNLTNESSLMMAVGDVWQGSTLTQPSINLYRELNLTYNTFRQAFTAGLGKNPYIAPSTDAIVKLESEREQGTKTHNPDPTLIRAGILGEKNPPFIAGRAPYQLIYGEFSGNGNGRLQPTKGSYWRDELLGQEKMSPSHGVDYYLAYDIKGGSYAYKCMNRFDYHSDTYGDYYYYDCEITRTDQKGEVSWTHHSQRYKNVQGNKNPYHISMSASSYGTENGSMLISNDGTKIGFVEVWGTDNYSSTKWFNIETLEPVSSTGIQPYRVESNWINSMNRIPLYEDKEVIVAAYHKAVQDPNAWQMAGYYTTLDYYVSFVRKDTGAEVKYPIYTNKQSYSYYSGSGCSYWTGGSTRSQYDVTFVEYAVSNDGVVYAVESLSKIHVLDKFGTKLKEIPTLNKTPRSETNCDSGYETSKRYGLRDLGFAADGKLVLRLTEGDWIYRPNYNQMSGLSFDTTGSYTDTHTFTIQKTMPQRPYGSNEIGQVLKKDTSIKNADFTFDVRQTVTNPSTSNPSGLNFRAQDHRNMYRLEISDKRMAVSKLVNGQRTQLGSAAIALNAEEFSTVKVSTRGNKIKVRYKGLPLFEVSDSTFEEGTYGFFMNAYGSNFRNLIVGVPIEANNELDNIGLVGEKLNYTTTFDDMEKDDRIEADDQWTYAHTDPDKFLDSGDGYSGRSSHHERTYATPRQSLDKVGVYSITYTAKDDPTPEGYKHPDPTFAEYIQQADAYTQFVTIHRRPIAKFTVKQAADYLVTYTDTSYDPDRYLPNGTCSKENTGINYCQTRGITSYTYEYIDPKGEKFDGQLRRPSYAGLYTLRLSVRDEYGAWSDWYEQELFLDGEPPNTPPVPGFTQSHTNTFRGVEITFDSTAYDAEDGARENLKHWYYIQSDQSGAVEVLASNSRTSWTKTFSSLGRFYIRQVVEDSGGLRATVQKVVNIANAPPTTNITNPSSTNQSRPTVLTELRPNLTWNYHDDGDEQARYQLRIYRYGGVHQYNTAEIASSDKFHVPTVDLPENVDMYVEVRAHDGYVWGEWSAPKYFRIVTNRPPVADFDWSPKPVYEGDRLRLIDRSSDPDGDRLTYSWRVLRPNGTTFTSTLASPELAGVAPGNYAATLTVSDGTATASTSKTITVLPLTITAEVHHTPLWLERHRDAGHETTEAPKDFYAGEILVLQATVSPAPVRTVTAVLDTQGLDRRRLLTTTPLSRVGTTLQYGGEMYDERWSSVTEGLPKGAQRIRFTVEYVNGVIKTAEVPIHIIGNVLESVGVHRRQ